MSNESDNARLGRALMGAVIGFVVLAAIPGVTYGPGANPLLGFVTGAIGAFIGFILGAATEAAEKTDSSLSWMKVGQRFTVTFTLIGSKITKCLLSLYMGEKTHHLRKERFIVFFVVFTARVLIRLSK